MYVLSDKKLVANVRELEQKINRLKTENGVFYRFLEHNDPQAIQELETLQANRALMVKSSKTSERKVQLSADTFPTSSSTALKAGSSLVVTTQRSKLNQLSRIFAPKSSVLTQGTETSETSGGLKSSMSGVKAGSTLSVGAQRSKLNQLSKIMSLKSSIFTQGTDISEMKPEKLCLAIKNDLVQRDLEEFVQVIEEKIKKEVVVKTKLIARVEELRERKEEVNKMVEEFDYFKEVYQPMTLNKFLRLLDEWNRKSRHISDKYRLRFSSLKIQYTKFSNLLTYKKQIGENLTEIDFEFLRNENTDLVREIERKHLLLIELKKMTGAGNLQLSQLGEVLREKQVRKAEVYKKIKDVEQAIIKADEDILRVYEERDFARNLYFQVKFRQEHYGTPDVLEYIKVKHKKDQVERETAMWKRRKIIRDRDLFFMTEKMKELLHTKHVHPCWFE